MDISQLKILNMMQTNLKYLNERQDVLSQNIANANIPGYHTKDLQAPDFSQAMAAATAGGAQGMQLATTEPGHISGSGTLSNFKTIMKPIHDSDITPSGNNVILEDEVMKMSKNGIEYQQTTDLYRKMIEMIKTAIGNV